MSKCTPLSLKATKQGELGSSAEAKKGSGASVNKELVGAVPVQKDGLTKDMGKKGTGATNDYAKLTRLANDKRLYA